MNYYLIYLGIYIGLVFGIILYSYWREYRNNKRNKRLIGNYNKRCLLVDEYMKERMRIYNNMVWKKN